MERKYSPGPWRLGGPAGSTDMNLHIYDANGAWVGNARPWSLLRANMEMQQGNAALMVAAPEMHALLSDAIALLEMTDEAKTPGTDSYTVCMLGNDLLRGFPYASTVPTTPARDKEETP